MFSGCEAIQMGLEGNYKDMLVENCVKNHKEEFKLEVEKKFIFLE